MMICQMIGYEKERSLFYHLIIWIGWIKVFPLIKKVEKQFMKMMVPQIVELVGVQERDIDSRHKGKTPKTISSSSSNDDGDNGGSKWGGGTSGDSRGVSGIGGDGSTGGSYVSQVDPDMSWA